MLRLIPKRDVDILKAREQQTKLEEGKTLAKRVDALRELEAKEQKNLADFREKTLKVIREETSRLSSENQALKSENQQLQVDRLALLQPVDLRNSWQEVKKAENTAKDWLLNLQKKTEILKTDTYDLEKEKEEVENLKKEEEIRLKEVTNALIAANNEKLHTEKIRHATEQILAKATKDIQEAQTMLSAKESELSGREEILFVEKQKLIHDAGELRIREAQLKDKMDVVLQYVK